MKAEQELSAMAEFSSGTWPSLGYQQGFWKTVML